MKKISDNYLKLTNAVIDEIGGTSAMAKWAERAPSTIHQWRTKGMPSAFYRLLKKEFPKFKAWSLV